MNLGPLMIDVLGTELIKADKKAIKHDAVGGVILFSRNFQHVEQLERLVAEIRLCKPDVMIGVDHEGGRVQRFREGFTVIPPAWFYQSYAEQQGKTAGLELAADSAFLMAQELKNVGVDFTFAPVLDIDTGLSEIIGDRAFGNNPDTAIEFASAHIRGLADAGMPAIGKHFPGHGSVQADSHIDLPIDDRPWEDIEKWDLQPFAKLIDQLQGVMPAHVIYPQVDEKAAGFSKHWLKTVLRKQLGFKGAIMSDDMSMEGARAAGTVVQGVLKSLNAGCDIVLICNNPDEVKNALKEPKLEIDASGAWAALKVLSSINSELDKTNRMQAARAHLEQALGNRSV